jgi:hypothetical protein
VLAEDYFGDYGTAEICKVSGQVDEQVVDGDHAHELIVAYDGQAADAVIAEYLEGNIKVRVRVDCHNGRAHNTVDAGVQGNAFGHGPADQVPVGHDAGETVTVNDRKRAYSGDLHECGGIADRAIRPDTDR